MSLPPVSICVTSYNSAAFIIETLESIKRQTYKALELIISDDCSKDNSVELVNAWLNIEDNKNRFIHTAVLTVPENTGVSANCNRCISAAQSAYIKFIAGDDVLLPSCVEDNMQFVLVNPDAHIVFSRVKVYRDTFAEENFIRFVPATFPESLMHPDLNAEKQHELLLISDRINFTPSFFCKKSALQSVGGFDEHNRLVEDYPMWLKLTKAGEKLHYFHKETVGYRMHANAMNNVSGDLLFRPSLIKGYQVRKQYAHPYLPWDIVGSEKYIVMVSKIFDATGMNKKTPAFAMLYNMGTIYLNPFRYIIFFKKKIMKRGRQNIFYADR